jgi:hypothetical protein
MHTFLEHPYRIFSRKSELIRDGRSGKGGIAYWLEMGGTEGVLPLWELEGAQERIFLQIISIK